LSTRIVAAVTECFGDWEKNVDYGASHHITFAVFSGGKLLAAPLKKKVKQNEIENFSKNKQAKDLTIGAFCRNCILENDEGLTPHTASKQANR